MFLEIFIKKVLISVINVHYYNNIVLSKIGGESLQYRGSYKGLEDVINEVVENRMKKIILIFIFFITFISTILMFTYKVENKFKKFTILFTFSSQI